MEIAANQDIRPDLWWMQFGPITDEQVNRTPKERERVCQHPSQLESQQLGFSSVVRAQDRLENPTLCLSLGHGRSLFVLKGQSAMSRSLRSRPSLPSTTTITIRCD